MFADRELAAACLEAVEHIENAAALAHIIVQIALRGACNRGVQQLNQSESSKPKDSEGEKERQGEKG